MGRIRDYLSFRRPLAFEAAARPDIPLVPKGEDHIDPIGAAGTVNYKGYLQPDEYNPDLRWPQSIKVWERMRRSDAAVREALWHIEAPVRAAEKSIEPPEDPSDLELEVTEFIRCAFFEWPDQSNEEFLQQALSYLSMGHAVFEPVYKLVSKSLRVKRRVDPEAADAEEMEAEEALEAAAPVPTGPAGPPDPALEVPVPEVQPQELVELPPRLFVTLRKLSQRLPATITEWNVDRAGELTSIKQLTPINGPGGIQTWEEITIGAEHLLVFTNERWGDEITGQSVLRAAYKAWTLKEVIERVMGIAYERHGVGIPVAYVPRDRENDQPLLDMLEEALTNLRAGEFSYLLFPGPKSTGNMPGFNFEIASPQGGLPDFEKALLYLRGEIKGAMLVRFSELGHGSTGARATAASQAEVWYAALTTVVTLISQQMNVLIRRLVDVNYPDVDRYPTFKFQGIKARNLLEFAQAVALLTNAGALNPDTPTREWVRVEIEAPQEDVDEAMQRQQIDSQRFALEKADTAGLFEPEPEQTARPRASKTNTPD